MTLIFSWKIKHQNYSNSPKAFSMMARGTWGWGLCSTEAGFHVWLVETAFGWNSHTSVCSHIHGYGTHRGAAPSASLWLKKHGICVCRSTVPLQDWGGHTTLVSPHQESHRRLGPTALLLCWSAARQWPLSSQSRSFINTEVGVGWPTKGVITSPQKRVKDESSLLFN